MSSDGQVVSLAGPGGSLAASHWPPATGVTDRGPLLLLHGGGQTRRSWGQAGPRLAQIGFDVWSVDARGHGESDWSAAGSYGSSEFVGDLVAVVATLGQAPIAIGASMGGMTALIAEGENPGLLRGLVLVDIVPRVEPAGVERITNFMRSAPDGFETLEEVAEAIRAYQPHRRRQPNVETVRKNVRLGANGRWFWHWDPAFLRPGNLDADVEVGARRVARAAAAVTVPTLLVHGALSDIVGAEGIAELQQLIPGARAIEVPGAGHMVAGDDNSIFLESIEDFLLSV